MKWKPPFETPLPSDPRQARIVSIARVGAWIVLIAALIVPVVQFQTVTMRNLRRNREFVQKHPDWTPSQVESGGPKRPKAHKGAIGRWRKAVPKLWAGENIYLRQDEMNEQSEGRIWLHPNMPFTLILMTPFAYMSVGVMALCWNLLKLLVLAATFLMVARIAGHRDRRIADWVLGLGLGWSVLLIIGDIQHGNTNVFVLGAIVLHLWLFRRGKDLWAGSALALAICLKMTPAIFLLYWLYQRNWRLLAATMAALIVFAVVIPAAALGPSHYATLTDTWLRNLIVPGLIEGAWYPIHINQSVSGVFSRYFLDGHNGNIFWNPDDNPADKQKAFDWINLVVLSPATVKMLIRVFQIAAVGLGAWAIGWRKLPRDDGRRMLHYGIVVTALLLLNQRTWDHHAGVLLIATVGIWQAIAFGRFGRAVRAWALAGMIAAGLLLLGDKSGINEGIARMIGYDEDAAEIFADRVKAYAPLFYHFILVLVTAAVLSLKLKDSQPPYSTHRQKLRG